MNIVDWIRCGPNDRQLTELAEQVASACHHQAWNQADHRAGTLDSIQEGRAYLRTRTSPLVWTKTQRLVRADQQLDSRCELLVVRRALSLVTKRLAGPMLQAAPDRRAA